MRHGRSYYSLIALLTGFSSEQEIGNRNCEVTVELLLYCKKTNTWGGHFYNAIHKTKALMVSIMRYVTLLHDDDQH